MARLTLLGVILAALLGLAGSAGAVEEELLPLRGGSGNGSFRVNSFLKTRQEADAWPGNDSKAEYLPKSPPFPGFLKWKNILRRQSRNEAAGFDLGGGGFREAAPYFGPTDLSDETGWLESLLPLPAALPGETRESERLQGEGPLS